MTRQTKDQFIAEMKKKPQTLGWDVVLAFDRNKTNYLLMQDYISRFGADSLFPPVDSSIDPVRGSTHELHGLQLDRPRLSFENAVITESRARCVMRTVGGRTIETTRPQGTSRNEVKRLGIADGLVGPVLTMTIHLKNAPGSIGSTGKVELSLAENGAADFTLSGVDTQFEAVQLGVHLNEIIKTWTDKQKTFELSELRQSSGDALQPTSFKVLTRSAAGAKSRAAEDFGDGEVLVLVGLDKRSGSTPSYDTDIPYLLPEGYSSNLIISYDQYFRRMIMPRLISIFGEYGATCKIEEIGAFRKYIISGGGLSVPEVQLGGASSFRFYCRRTELPFDNMNIRVDDNAVALSWAGKSSRVWGHTLLHRDNPEEGPWEYEGDFSATWNLVQAFRAVLEKDGSNDRTLLAIESVEKSLTTGHELYNSGGDRKCEASFRTSINEHFVVSCRDRVVFLQEKFESTHQTIDAFRLNGLLFRDEAVVVPKDVDLPGDLTILGDISMPAHQISETEVTVASGTTHSFSIQPAGTRPTWTVSDPLDTDTVRGRSAASVGTIDANGLYKAPLAASFDFTSKRVVITATGDGWSSKALVNLVAAPVSVFPLVNVVNLTNDKDEGYVVWAASTNKTALSWKLTGNAGGTLSKTNDPEVQESQRYKGPATFPTDGVSQADKKIRVDRVEVSPAGGTAVVCEMVLANAPSANFYFKYSAVGDGVQFESWLTGESGKDVQLPSDSVAWHKVSGLGALSAAGKYTQPSAVREHYIIVAAFFEDEVEIPLLPDPILITFWNYIILPLPLPSLLLPSEVV